MEKTDIVMRHGQFERHINADPYKEFQDFLSNPDTFPLSQDGAEEIKRSLDAIQEKERISLIISSPYARAKESAEVIQQELRSCHDKDVPIQPPKLLRDIDIAPDVLSKEEFTKILSTGGEDAVAGAVFEKWRSGQTGQLPEKVEKRAKDFLKYVRRIHKWTANERLIIVSHASFLRALQRVIEGKSVTLPRKETQKLETAGKYHIARNPQQEKPALPGIQHGEFMLLPTEQIIDAQ